MDRIKEDIRKFSYLRFWAKIAQFLIAIPIKQASPIKTTLKSVQFWGELAQKSLKIQNCFQTSRACVLG